MLSKMPTLSRLMSSGTLVRLRGVTSSVTVTVRVSGSVARDIAQCSLCDQISSRGATCSMAVTLASMGVNSCTKCSAGGRCSQELV